MTIENYFERRIRPISEDIKSQTQTQTTNNLIDEDQLARTFQEIVNCINLDDDNEDEGHLVTGGMKPHLPLEESRHVNHHSSTIFNGHGHLLPEYESIFGGAKGSFNVTVGSKSNGSVSNNSSVGNLKSFLDDDWFPSSTSTSSSSNVSSNTSSNVSASLVRPPGYPTAAVCNTNTANNLINRPLTPSSSTSFSSSSSSNNNNRSLTFNSPPRDYVCKLCNCDGHWMKDCKLYEPRTPPSSISSGSFKSASDNTTSSSTMQISRTLLPPGNYVCRLCNVAGHWIDQCSKFQPKDSGFSANSSVSSSGSSTSISLPPMLGPGPTPNYRPPAYLSKPVPSNYICNLCNRPGHWIQQCSEFTPIINHKRQ